VILAALGGDGSIEAVPPDTVAQAVATISGMRPSSDAFDVAVAHPGPATPEEEAALAAAGATWLLATGWLDDLAALVP
jgi:hypothetical protein